MQVDEGDDDDYDDDDDDGDDDDDDYDDDDDNDDDDNDDDVDDEDETNLSRQTGRGLWALALVFINTRVSKKNGPSVFKKFIS